LFLSCCLRSICCPDQFGDPAAWHLVERLQHVDRLGDDQVGEEQLVGRGEERCGLPGLLRWVAGEMSDQDVGVDERAHPAPRPPDRGEGRQRARRGQPGRPTHLIPSRSSLRSRHADGSGEVQQVARAAQRGPTALNPEQHVVARDDAEGLPDLLRDGHLPLADYW
jgi:hypothetical protein